MENLIVLDREKCTGCGLCLTDCSYRNYLFEEKGKPPVIVEDGCIQCGHCVCKCPTGALSVGSISPNTIQSVDFGKIASFDQFAELVKYRRSIRDFKKDPIRQEDLDRLFEMLRWAPTAKNLLMIKWIVVNDWDTVHELASLLLDGVRDQESSAKMIKAWDEQGYDWIHRGAPCLAIATMEEETIWTMTDAAIAAETLDLGAAALGIGACWAGLFMNFIVQNEAARKRIGLSEKQKVGAALMLGYPAGKKYSKTPLRPKCDVRYVQ
ncbi:MAG: nitroreductase family protein [Planctomycetia bacterium]|nr:nitroreductase family protein [Planctomycetia bacterium]